jgi:lipoyl(octanoyl) transferase
VISVLNLGLIDYGTALQLQSTLVDLRKQQRISDTLLLLEHPAVITLGRNASQKHLLAPPELLAKKGVELFESNRGGDITFHGPGQLVGYPICDLRGFSPRIGAVEFVRRIEEALIRACGDLGIPCGRICGLTGVWTQSEDSSGCIASRQKTADTPLSKNEEQKKIAAIGIHISRGITSHGFALNVTTDLEYFKLIVPCGIGDRPVTSVAQELVNRAVPTMEQMEHAVSLNFGRVFGRQTLWLESLHDLLNTGANGTVPHEPSSALPSTTMGVPLRVPGNLRELRDEQQAPQLTSEDKVFLV